MGIAILINVIKNKIEGNKISRNDNRGLTLEGDNNTIFLNNFSNNIDENAMSNGFNNKWDNGPIGNYYSDYMGIDANDDGIGDTPHSIIGSEGSQDNFPIWDDGFNGNPIFIDDQASGVGAYNWTWASNQIWCTGTGVFADPYVIQNFLIPKLHLGI